MSQRQKSRQSNIVTGSSQAPKNGRLNNAFGSTGDKTGKTAYFHQQKVLRKMNLDDSTPLSFCLVIFLIKKNYTIKREEIAQIRWLLGRPADKMSRGYSRRVGTTHPPFLGKGKSYGCFSIKAFVYVCATEHMWTSEGNLRCLSVHIL